MSTLEITGFILSVAGVWLTARQHILCWPVGIASVGAADADQPEAYFVGEYGRMRAVVRAPDGSLWLTTSNLDGRGEPADGDDRILRVEPQPVEP